MGNSKPMHWLAAALVFGIFAVPPGSAAAQGAVATPGTAARGFDCTCRFGGQSYAQNARVCIVTPNGVRLAFCGKVLNNSSWIFNGDACPITSLSVPDRPVAEGDAPANQSYADLSLAVAR
jgi:hypothetical protein